VSNLLFFVQIQLSAITLEQSLTLPDSLKFLQNKTTKMSLFVIENDHIGSLGNQVSCSRRKIVETMSKKEKVEVEVRLRVVGYPFFLEKKLLVLVQSDRSWCDGLPNACFQACKWNVSKSCLGLWFFIVPWDFLYLLVVRTSRSYR